MIGHEAALGTRLTVPARIVGTQRLFQSCSLVSRGEYGIPDGLQFGFPVTITAGQPHVVDDLELTAQHRDLLARTTEELLQEQATALLAAEGHS